jgi:hypothetical protein
MFYDFQELIHIFLVLQGKKCTTFPLPTLDLGTPFSTRSGTRSGTLSSTSYCTETEGYLAVMALAASDG